MGDWGGLKGSKGSDSDEKRHSGGLNGISPLNQSQYISRRLKLDLRNECETPIAGKESSFNDVTQLWTILETFYTNMLFLNRGHKILDFHPAIVSPFKKIRTHCSGDGYPNFLLYQRNPRAPDPVEKG